MATLDRVLREIDASEFHEELIGHGVGDGEDSDRWWNERVVLSSAVIVALDAGDLEVLRTALEEVGYQEVTR